MKVKRFLLNLYLQNIGASGKTKLKNLKSQKIEIRVKKASTQEKPKRKLTRNIDDDEEEEGPQLTRKKINRQRQPTFDERSESEDSSPMH